MSVDPIMFEEAEEPAPRTRLMLSVDPAGKAWLLVRLHPDGTIEIVEEKP